ncbi:hypothetical protein EI555_009033, partial [Monodon monoceros]
EEVRPIPVQHPTKVQGLIERYKAEKQLLALGETKFLIPDHMTVSDASMLERAFLLLVNRHNRGSMSTPISK